MHRDRAHLGDLAWPVPSDKTAIQGRFGPFLVSPVRGCLSARGLSLLEVSTGLGNTCEFSLTLLDYA